LENELMQSIVQSSSSTFTECVNHHHHHDRKLRFNSPDKNGNDDNNRKMASKANSPLLQPQQQEQQRRNAAAATSLKRKLSTDEKDTYCLNSFPQDQVVEDHTCDEDEEEIGNDDIQCNVIQGSVTVHYSSSSQVTSEEDEEEEEERIANLTKQAIQDSIQNNDMSFTNDSLVFVKYVSELNPDEPTPTSPPNSGVDVEDVGGGGGVNVEDGGGGDVDEEESNKFNVGALVLIIVGSILACCGLCAVMICGGGVRRAKESYRHRKTRRGQDSEL